MALQPADAEHPKKAFGWAARDTSGVLSPFKFSRRETGEKDVTFKVLYCGICHSDLHMLKNEWGNSIYPIVPGHEIAGEVTEVGSKVQKFKVGDRVGVGCLVGSCRSCQSCGDDLENYCPKMILTYSAKYVDGTITYGGYSDTMVADEHFVIRIPDGLPLDAAAPLLCAGITVYSPLKYFGLDKPGLHVGVVGLGGLGHMAVKFAKAFGVKVTVISTSPNKKKEAIEHLGADSFVVSREQDQMQAIMGTLDGIIDTVSAVHPLLPLICLLKSHGKLVMVGAPEKPLELPVFPLIGGRKIIGGSCIGGLKETQEMIDFAAKHGVKPEIEVIPIDYVNTAMERLVKADVKYRFVIDIGNTLKDEFCFFLEAKVAWFGPCLPLREREATALLAALQWTSDLGLDHIIFELDAKVVVDSVNNNGDDVSEFGSIISACREALISRQNCSMIFVKRQVNTVVHALARAVVSMPCNCSFDFVPDCVVSIIANEMI